MTPRTRMGSANSTASALRRSVAAVQAACSRAPLDALGDDERRIEADPELPDELRGFLLIPRQRAEEFRGTRARNGAEVGDGLLARHADAVVGDGQRTGAWVGIDADAQIGGLRQQRAVFDRCEAQPIAGVGG